MEIASEKEINEVKSIAFKNTVESLLLSIERKAEEDPETVETGKIKIDTNKIDF